MTTITTPGRPAAATSWRFGDVEVDPVRREVRRDGRTVETQPRVFDLIVYLIRQRDRVVGRDELLDEVWGTRFIAASTVNGRIRVARQVLGDTGDEQSVIRTMHGRGYRFVAEIDPDHADHADHRPPIPGVVPPPPTPTTPDTPVAPVEPLAPVGPVDEWPLVGQVDLLDRIDAAFGSGTTGGVVVAGADGVGTSRVAATAGRRLAATGARVVTTRGLDGAADVPLSGLAQLIDASVLESAHTAADLARADVMHKTTGALRSLASDGSRLVIVVDDVHHMDPMSMAVLASLVEARAIFLVAACRRTALPTRDCLDPLVDAGVLELAWIAPLTAIQIDVLLYRALRGPIDAGSLESFVTASSGRPGHLRDLVERARSTGALAFEGGVWRLVGPIPTRVPLVWPAPGLSDAAVRAAEILAIIGEIPVSLCAELCDDDAIDELDAHRLLTVSADGDDPLVRPAEPALAAIIVDSIGALRRQRLRRQVAEQLVATAPDDASALAAVLDCGATADDVDRRRACSVARRLFDDGQVDRAIRLVDRMRDWPESDAIVLRAEAAAYRSQWELADRLLADIADARLDSSSLTAAVTLGADLDFFQRAEHEQAIDRLARHTEASESESERAELRRLWLLAEQGAADALTDALSSPSSAMVRAAPEWTLASAVSAMLAGRFVDSLDAVTSLESADTSSLTQRQIDAIVTLKCLALRDLGRLDEARDFARAAIALQGSGALGFLPIVGAGLELEAGFPRAARVLLGALADSSHVRRHPFLAPVLAGAAASVESELGHHDAADRLYEAAERDLDRAPRRAAWMVRTAMARALARREPDRARRHARTVASEARQLGAALPEAGALLALSLIDRRDPDPDVVARVGELIAGFDGPRWRTIHEMVVRLTAPATTGAHTVRTPSS